MYSESLKTSAEEIPNEQRETGIFPDNRERSENMETQPQTVEPKNEIETFARETKDARETFERIQKEQGGACQGSR